MVSFEVYTLGHYHLGRIFLSIFGVVNLDIFHDIYSLFCISPNFTILHVLSLDFIVVLYPYFLDGPHVCVNKAL